MIYANPIKSDINQNLSNNMMIYRREETKVSVTHDASIDATLNNYPMKIEE